MKTSCHKLMSLIFAMVLAAAGSSHATELVDSSALNPRVGTLLAGDTFTPGTWLVRGGFVPETNWEPTLEPQTRAFGNSLVDSTPEIREFDENAGATLRENLLSIKWQGSDSFFIRHKSTNEASPDYNNGIVARDAAEAERDGGKVAFVESFRPSTDDNWRIRADVRPGAAGSPTTAGANSVSIGFFSSQMKSYVSTDTLLGDNPSAEDARGGLGEIWAMLSTVQVNGQVFGRLCLFIAGDNMIARFENTHDNLSPGGLLHGKEFPDAVYADLDFDPNDLNPLFLEWHTDSNSVSVKLGERYVIGNEEAGLSLETPEIAAMFGSTNGGRPDIFGVGFQMLGSGELDNFQATPEPSSVLMMCFGMLFFGLHTRRQRRHARKMGSMGLSLSLTH